MNLYLVKCKGMTHATGNDCVYGVAYVVAADPQKVYELLREDLDRRDLGFRNERSLDSITLLAEEETYPDCGYRLYLDLARQESP